MSRTVATSPRGTGTSLDFLLRDLTQSSFIQSSDLSSLSSQLDSLTTHFVDQAANPITLAAMVAGGMAFRLGRIGVMAATSGHVADMPLRILSYGIGLGSEVTAFELTHRTLHTLTADHTGPPLQHALRDTLHASRLWSFSGPGGWREGLLSSFITFGTLRGMGSLAQGQNLVLQHALQSSAMVMGHQATAQLGIMPRPDGDLAAQFLHAEATNLQLVAGMGMLHRLAPGIHSWERTLDLSQSSPSPQPWFDGLTTTSPSWERGMEWGWAMAAEGRDIGSPGFHNHTPSSGPSQIDAVFSMNMGGGGGGKDGRGVQLYAPTRGLPSPERARELNQRFFPRFPALGDPRIYSDEIIERALTTPSTLPLFHERLLEALSQAPERGTLAQRHTADAIKRTFQFDSLNTSTGTLENALLQLLLGRTVNEENVIRRAESFQALFQAMEQGLSRSVLEGLLSRDGSLGGWGSSISPLYPPDFLNRHEGTLRQELADYSLRQKVQILNFLHQEFAPNPGRAQRALEIFGEARRSGQFDPVDIDAALQYARRVPYGRVVLRRMLAIFVVQDIPAKLIELTSNVSPVHNTLYLAREASRHGFDPQTLAEAINGSRHTAYIRDMRLARKVVSVMGEMAFYFDQSLQERQNERRIFRNTIEGFLHSGAELNSERLMDLININSTPQTRRLRELWRQGAFELRFAPDQEINDLLEKWRHVSSDVSHLFYGGEGVRPDQILMRRFSHTDPSLSSLPARYSHLIHHLRGGVHEGEHWRHFTGHFEGVEEGGEAFPILSLGRDARLTTEIMALMEDNAWMTRNVTDTDWEITRRMGLNLPLYYRAVADHGYYGRTNERLAREW